MRKKTNIQTQEQLFLNNALQQGHFWEKIIACHSHFPTFIFFPHISNRYSLKTCPHISLIHFFFHYTESGCISADGALERMSFIAILFSKFLSKYVLEYSWGSTLQLGTQWCFMETKWEMWRIHCYFYFAISGCILSSKAMTLMDGHSPLKILTKRMFF